MMNHLVPFALAASVVLASFAASARADEVTLVKDGASDDVVVLSKDATPAERWAARELVDHVRQMSGAELKIVDVPPAVPERAVLLGGEAAAAALGLRGRAALGPEEFVIAPRGERLVVAGGRPRGVLYGVYTLLETLGCRWWTPTESTIPEKKTIVVPDGEVRRKPAFEYRDMMFGNSWGAAARLWCARNKLNGFTWEDGAVDDIARYGGRYKFGGGSLVHTYWNVIRQSGQPVTDDMKALVKGKRSNDQPCLTNPDVLDAMVAGVVKIYRDDPELRFVVIGQHDTRTYCTCESCQKLIDENDSPAGPVIHFANRVAEAVARQVPGAQIATPAYLWSRKPPLHVKPADNVRIVLCPIECDFAHPIADAGNEWNKAFKDDIEGWARISRNIVIWTYCGNRTHYLLPNPDLDARVANLKFFAANNVSGVFVQGTHRGRATEFSPLKMWLLAKGLWDADADGKALVREFVQGYYGPAAADVQKYIDLIHSVALKQQFQLGRRVYMDAPFLSPAIIAESESIMRDAERKVAGDADLARRVRLAHAPVLYVLAKRGPGTRTWAAAEQKVGPLDIAALSGALAATCKESSVDFVSDPVKMDIFLGWLADYAARVRDRGGRPPVPPELAGAPPSRYRLVQACQMDNNPAWWKKADGASDGWCVDVPKSGWHTNHRFAAVEGFTPGKSYKVVVRAHGNVRAGDGGADAWEFGMYPRGTTRKVSLGELDPSRWQTFESAPFTAAGGQYFWTALTRPQTVTNVQIDCIWLVEAPVP